MQKRGFEFSFAWLFAILVGAVILFLAIYGVTRIIETGKYETGAITAKQLSIIFEPLETGLASGKSNIARLKEETRIINKCFPEGDFGLQRISLSIKSGLGKKWSEPSPKGGIPITNKYIFSQDIEEGKEVYFFSKSFEMPWKISEIIFLTTQKYCFINAPYEVEKDASLLENINLKNCSSNDIRVCFGFGEDCDIKVRGDCRGADCESEYDFGVVEKINEEGERESLVYIKSLKYGAIFSSKEIYECNVRRLMKRLFQQSLIYQDEANFISSKCGSLPVPELISLRTQAKNLADSGELGDLLILKQTADNVNKQNEIAECSLW